MGAADNFFQKAEQALKKRNFDYAIELYQQGLSIDPDRVEERRKLRASAVRRCQENGANTMGGRAFKLKNGLKIGVLSAHRGGNLPTQGTQPGRHRSRICRHHHP